MYRLAVFTLALAVLSLVVAGTAAAHEPGAPTITAQHAVSDPVAQIAHRRTVINMTRVRGKAMARAVARCHRSEKSGYQCLGHYRVYECQRQDLYHPDIGWCLSSFLIKDRMPGRTYGAIYSCYAMHAGYSRKNRIRWWPHHWGCTRVDNQG